MFNDVDIGTLQLSRFWQDVLFLRKTKKFSNNGTGFFRLQLAHTMHPFNLNGPFNAQLVIHHIFNLGRSLFPAFTMIFSDFFTLEIVPTGSIFKIVNTINYVFLTNQSTAGGLLAHQLSFQEHVQYLSVDHPHDATLILHFGLYGGHFQT